MRCSQKRPTQKSANVNEARFATWLSNQQKSVKTRRYIMKENDISELWISFVTSEEFKKYFPDTKQDWKQNLENTKKFIKDNRRKPISTSKNEYEKYLGMWTSSQITKYNYKRFIMADEEIYQMWGEFISSKEYAQYFLDNKERWKRELENVKKYIQKTGKRPTETCKNKNEKQLKRWIVTQVMSFEPRDYIMKEDDIYQLWKDFIYSDEFKKYF